MILVFVLEVDYGPHKYTYVHGDPVQGTDPTGLFTVSGLVGSIGNIAARVGRVARVGYRVYRVAERVQTFIELAEFVRTLPIKIPTLQREVRRFIREIGSAPVLASIPPEELLNTFEEVLRELREDPINGLFGTAVNLHKARIGEALASRKIGRTHSVVIYLPTVPSRSFGRDTQLRRIPGFKILDMPVELSFGGRGGRLWGIGFAKHRRDRTYRVSSYQIFRVDYHRVQHRDHLHREPYANFFRMNDNARNHEFHWQIPTSPKDARGGRNSE